MSPAGPASALGPEKWSAMLSAPLQGTSPGGPDGRRKPGSRPAHLLGSVGRQVQQRLQGGVFQRLGGGGVVQHLLESMLHGQRLPDLLHRRLWIGAVVAGRRNR